MTKKSELLEKLTRYHQEHVLEHWESLTESQQRNFAEQINAIDLTQLAGLYRLYRNRDKWSGVVSLIDQAEAPLAFRLHGKNPVVIPRGKKALKSGKVAVLIVAGGQGTRLGFEHPKGMYPIGPVSGATLFQIHIEKIIAKSRQYGKPIPLCIMTGPSTHEETMAFLNANNRFGLAAEDLYLFCQKTMPAVSGDDGKLLLDAPDHLAVSPDGHGGMLRAIDESGTLEKLANRGIEQLFYFQVDNPLVDVGNEEFLGYHLENGSELTSQVVRKQNPKEKVGNVVNIHGKLHVIEYSDLPDEAAERRKPDGSLEIWAGSIAVHVMDLSFLQKQAKKPNSLPFHVAKKKVSFLSSSGTLQPHPNAIKFERFIFDLLPVADNAIVVEVDAESHFAPLKNGTGSETDSPESVKKQCSDFHAGWLKQVGAKVAPNIMVEISPLFANSVEELTTKIKPGTIIDRDQYFHLQE